MCPSVIGKEKLFGAWSYKCVYVPAGKREQLKGSPEQQILEQQHTDNQLPAASGGASGTLAGKKSRFVVEPLSKPQNNLRAPRTPVPTPVQAVKSPPAQPGVSHNASVLCNSQRTVPNILSRSRKPSLTLSNDTEGKTAGHQQLKSGWQHGIPDLNLESEPSRKLLQRDILCFVLWSGSAIKAFNWCVLPVLFTLLMR